MGRVSGTPVCSEECVREFCGPAFIDSYYNMAIEIYKHVRRMYPNSQIWTVGHSLGGALAASVAVRFRTPAVAFESPGDALWARRVNALPKGINGDPRAAKSFHESLPVFHVGNDGDPIFLGKCNGVSSSCYFSGYAIETRCHNGKWCVYENGKLDHPPPEDQEPAPTPEPSPNPDPGPGDGADEPGDGSDGSGWCWHGFGWCKHKDKPGKGNDTAPIPTPAPAPQPSPPTPSPPEAAPDPPDDPWWCFWCTGGGKSNTTKATSLSVLARSRKHHVQDSTYESYTKASGSGARWKVYGGQSVSDRQATADFETRRDHLLAT
ncbi:putative lipase atg15, partial [Gonapodya sp. JEL0774]